HGARPPAARVAGPALGTLGHGGPPSARLSLGISQQRGRAARAGGVAGRRRRSATPPARAARPRCWEMPSERRALGGPPCPSVPRAGPATLAAGGRAPCDGGA